MNFYDLRLSDFTYKRISCYNHSTPRRNNGELEIGEPRENAHQSRVVKISTFVVLTLGQNLPTGHRHLHVTPQTINTCPLISVA